MLTVEGWLDSHRKSSWKLKQMFLQHRIHQYLILLFYFGFLLFMHYLLIIVLALCNFNWKIFDSFLCYCVIVIVIKQIYCYLIKVAQQLLEILSHDLFQIWSSPIFINNVCSKKQLNWESKERHVKFSVVNF